MAEVLLRTGIINSDLFLLRGRPLMFSQFFALMRSTRFGFHSFPPPACNMRNLRKTISQSVFTRKIQFHVGINGGRHKFNWKLFATSVRPDEVDAQTAQWLHECMFITNFRNSNFAGR